MIPSFAESVERKIRSLGGIVPEGGLKVFSFIDCTQIPTSRPGGGPKPNGRRNNPLIQRSFYNGWKHNHGLKVQTIDLPNGMNLHVTNASSLRHNDLFVWHESDMSRKLDNLLGDHGYSVYGDSAYAILNDPHVSSRRDDDDENGAPMAAKMSSCRESIEWNYGHVKNLFKLMPI